MNNIPKEYDHLNDEDVSYRSIEQDKWQTYDLAIAAVLRSCGYELLNVERDAQAGKSRFVFPRSASLLELVSDYYADRVQCNPRLLFDAQKLIKSIIYASE